jgi:hypothetical protein
MLRLISIVAAAWCFVAAPSLAQDASALQRPMTAEEFETYVTGRTLTYGIDGTAYGIEQYLPDRRVMWSFIGEECRQGTWYEDRNNICFIYEHDGTPQCWAFFETEQGLRAQFKGENPGADLYEVEQSPAALSCAGPALGV